MSAVQDEDERRRRSLEAGRELLEKYKARRSTKGKGTCMDQSVEQSDDESLHNEKAMSHKESVANEGISSRDITHSSVSISEGEADADLDGLAGRVAELEELLQGKEAIVGALNAEIDHLRAEASSPNSSQSHNSSTHGREVISLYHIKLQEFERAVNQRDNLIEHLTASLEQALSARDTVTAQLNALNLVQLNNPVINNVNLQQKIDVLETTMSDQKALICRLNAQLTDIRKHVQTLEMERETRNAEINDYKMQIDNLNEQIRFGAAEKNLNIDETLEQQKQYEARVDKIKQDMQHILNKFTTVTNANAMRHQHELKDLTFKNEAEIANIKTKHEECTKVLKDENKTLADRLNKELPDLESRHAKELSVFQTQLAYYKETVETLKVELTSHADAQRIAQSEVQLYKSKFDEVRLEAENERRMQSLHFQREKELLNEQIKLHKIQLEEITSKHIATMSILESKESIERSLDQALTNAASLRQQNDALKFKLDDLSSRYSTAQSILENSQLYDQASSGRIHELERSSSRFDATSMSTNSELAETMYKTFDEEVIQHQMMKRELDEKTELEKLLVDRIHAIEEDLLKARDELEESNLAKEAYEKQLKDMKNTCDKLQQEVNSLREPSCATPRDASAREYPDDASANDEGDLAQRLKDHQEIESLKLLVEEKETENASLKKDLTEMTEKARRLETNCNQLKDGLAQAWAQCAEFEEKLNQTLEMSDNSKVNASYLNSTSSNVHPKTNQSLDGNPNPSDQNVAGVTEPNNGGASTLTDNSYLKSDNENLYKELQQLLSGESSLDEVKLKLRRYYSLCEQMAVEKTRSVTDDATVDEQQDGEEQKSLKKSLDDLRVERELLSQEIENVMNQRKEELESVKTDSAKEINRLRLLLQNLKDGDGNLNELRAELEARHAKEMEELRTYFERKCLQMEKQYSEEVFSQQSKRISDNDSETEELTDDLYFGGAGDCLNVSNSRAATPGAIEESLKSKILDVENQACLEPEYDNNIQALRQELEHKVNEVQSINADYTRAVEEKELYKCQLRDLEAKLERIATLSTIHQYCQTEWEALEIGELSSLRDSYNHQLEEQIALARQDIVNALQEQFQALLSVEADKEDNWPAELLELRDKFTSNAKQEIQELKKMHNAELARLKDEHDCIVARMLEQHQKEIATVQGNTSHMDNNQEIDYIGALESNITEERDNLRRTCVTLKNLIGELVNYFAVCEEEVNNTLINEVLKRQSIESILSNEENLKKDDNAILSETRHKDASNQSVKRVHFAPQFSKIISIVNSDNKTLQSLVDEDVDEILKKELKACLKRLKSESNQILNLSLLAGEDKNASPSKEILLANKINEELSVKLNHAETLIMGYQEEVEQLKLHIIELQWKLINAENKKEVITEGYGESDLSRGDNALQDLLQVQEKARHVLSNGGGDTSYLLQLIEELCRQNDKLMDDVRKEREDLQQQVPLEPTPTPYIHRVCCKKIEAADKKLRATCRFLDDQASEREMEREEAAKQIRFLQEQLKEREREKERDMRISSESELSSETTDIPELQSTDINAAVEALESQMREMSSLMSDTEAKKSEKESELKAAIDKIRLLRDIITDLEQQLQVKAEREESLQLQISQLETVVIAQTKNQQELVQELDAIKSGSESRHLNEQINHLQEELSKHKLSSEHFNGNSSVLKQMKAELHEMQNQLDKRIRELESAHMCGSNLSLSQPSEDVSIREQIDATRCLTPDDPSAPPMLPLNQVLKLKDKMLKHARAEDVAFKRIKDLEMQLTTMKNQNEELLAEQEILQQTASEQLYQIEAMRGRLEQHKQSAPFAQKQATSRLELQLHEATAKYHSLEQTITNREMELKELRAQLERATQLLTEKETEMENLVQSENDTLQKLKDQLKLVQDQLKLVQEEKKTLQIKLGTQEHTQQELPQLIDTILADKNEEIDHLKEQLSKKEKQLNVYSSLALDDTQLKELTRQAEAKNSARTLSDILSIHSECEELPEAIRAINVTHATSHISSFKIPASRNTLNTNSFNPMEASLPDTEKMSTHVPPLDLDSHTHSFSNDVRHPEIELQNTEGESKLSSPKNNDSEDSQQAEELLNEKLKEIENLSNQLQILQQELEIKSDLLSKYEVELASLQKQYQNLQDESKEAMENLVRDKNFYKGQYELAQASESKIKKDLEEVENILKLKVDELEDHKGRMQVNERIITELNTENTKLKKEMEKDRTKRNNSLQERTQELETFKELILEKDIALETLKTRNIEIENENKQLYDFKTIVHAREREIAELQDKILRLTDGLNSRDQIIRKLEEMAKRSEAQSDVSSPSSHSNKDEEIQHLQEFLKEKDKVIRQMSDDSKSLQRALETIQNKMKESGNIVELRKKLKEERRWNTELKNMVQILQKELEQTETSTQQDDSDIEDMVQRELNLSARLDQQILEVIKDDTEQAVAGASGDHQRSLNDVRRDNEMLKRLKDNLEIEQDIMKHQIAEYEERILQLKADLTEETKKVVKLDKELVSEKNVTKFLRLQIDEHRRSTEMGQVQDTELIEFLQTKLKTTLENEEKLRNDLFLMGQHQIVLESQLTSMKKLIEAENASRNMQMFTATARDGPDSTISDGKTRRTSGNLEESRENNAELRENIRRLEVEMSKYEKRLEIATEERENLIKSLALVNRQKDISETNLQRTMEELKAREDRCDYLQKQLRMLTEIESKKQEQRDAELHEMKGLRKEINVAREAKINLEADIKPTKKELKDSLDRELKLAQTVESLKEREAELNSRLAYSREKERKLKDLIEELQPNSKSFAIEVEEDVRNKLPSTTDVPAKNFVRKIKELNEVIEKYAADKNNLQDKLCKMKVDRTLLTQRVKLLEGEMKRLKGTQASNQQTVPAEKLQTFYGKYLRSESRRKSLAYQKKYLLCIVGSYQYCENNTLYMLAQLTQSERTHTRLSRDKKVRLRIVTLVIISIHRMKWLIRRWRTGKRVGANVIMGGIDQLFELSPIKTAASNHSPPVRDRATHGSSGRSGLIEQYYQQVKHFQETVDLAMLESGTSHIITE
ncbi:GRIP and coiled-coil domain-containing protein 2 isoform X2 [Ooceraea biroi]|uniref:GRIP and coiled-coil domain-containing protein 2 isoform X2 n=1 Tax=Ooceraea biroi TaxID=2015173 RepID=UPI000F092216|nr:GRIP and coiled-coil domain-containing protein 2 isoform X2 [Ooceraea biroi]